MPCKAFILDRKGCRTVCSSLDAKVFYFLGGGRTRAINREDGFRSVSAEVRRFTLVAVHHPLRRSCAKSLRALDNKRTKTTPTRVRINKS